MSQKPNIELTDDGTTTLRHHITGEYYHSLRGAEGESLWVYINNGFLQINKPIVRIFEMGFGSGLNAYMTMKSAQERGVEVHYTAIELYPVNVDTAKQLSWGEDDRFLSLHYAPWGEDVEVEKGFTLHKIEGDLVNAHFLHTFDLVYFDAFAPECQPELWSVDIFKQLYVAMEQGGILVTYSAKGSVKEALREAGFFVKRKKGALGKKHLVTALKNRGYGEEI